MQTLEERLGQVKSAEIRRWLDHYAARPDLFGPKVNLQKNGFSSLEEEMGYDLASFVRYEMLVNEPFDREKYELLLSESEPIDPRENSVKTTFRLHWIDPDPTKEHPFLEHRVDTNIGPDRVVGSMMIAPSKKIPGINKSSLYFSALLSHYFEYTESKGMIIRDIDVQFSPVDGTVKLPESTRVYNAYATKTDGSLKLPEQLQRLTLWGCGDLTGLEVGPNVLYFYSNKMCNGHKARLPAHLRAEMDRWLERVRPLDDDPKMKKCTFGIQGLPSESHNYSRMLTEFLVDLFGNDVDVLALGEYFGANGEITALRKLKGGVSAQGVIEQGGIVTKLHNRRREAENQRSDIVALNGLDGFLPLALSDVEEQGGLYLWQMSNVDIKYTDQNLFDLTRKKRAMLDEKARTVQWNLKNNSAYTAANQKAQQAGAQDLYDYLDHFMYLVGIFHKESGQRITRPLSIGPSLISGMDHETRLLTFEEGNKDVYGRIREIYTPLFKADIFAKFKDVAAMLRAGTLYVTHGNYEPKNTVNGGAIVDPHTILSKPYVDTVRFVTAPKLGLPLNIAAHFAVTRYNHNRSLHDPEFADNEELRRSMRQGVYLAESELALRRVVCMQRRDLNQPANLVRMERLVDVTLDAFRRVTPVLEAA